MADQCIVCLEVLDVAPVASASGLPLEVAPPAATAIATATASDLPTASSAAKPENHDNVAQIKVCGHMLHDSCLREWTEKANSCPICRQTFNSVQVYDKVNGEFPSLDPDFCRCTSGMTIANWEFLQATWCHHTQSRIRSKLQNSTRKHG